MWRAVTFGQCFRTSTKQGFPGALQLSLPRSFLLARDICYHALSNHDDALTYAPVPQ